MLCEGAEPSFPAEAERSETSPPQKLLHPPLQDKTAHYSLGIGLLQQGAPELVPLSGLSEDQLVVEGRDTVVNDDIDPVAIAPELKARRRQKQYWGSSISTPTNFKHVNQRTWIISLVNLMLHIYWWFVCFSKLDFKEDKMLKEGLNIRMEALCEYTEKWDVSDLEVEDAAVSLWEALLLGNNPVQKLLIQGETGDGGQQPAVASNRENQLI